MTGVLAPGKRYEMVFQYTPSEDKLQVLPAALLCIVICNHSHLYMTSLAACQDCQLLPVLCTSIVLPRTQGQCHASAEHTVCPAWRDMLLSTPVLVPTLCLWALQESFWRFKIPEHKLDVPVLVVGHVSEPRVAFDCPSLSFGKVLIGGRTHATVNLFNSEHMPFQFDLDKASYDASPARLESTGILALILCQWFCLVLLYIGNFSARWYPNVSHAWLSVRLLLAFADVCAVCDIHYRCRQSYPMCTLFY